MQVNPMHKAHACPRCGAKTRKNGHCRAPAMKNGRCRMHGGKSPGAPRGEAHGRYLHGRYTKEEIAKRKLLSSFLADGRQLIDRFHGLKEILNGEL